MFSIVVYYNFVTGIMWTDQSMPRVSECPFKVSVEFSTFDRTYYMSVQTHTWLNLLRWINALKYLDPSLTTFVSWTCEILVVMHF